MSKNFQSSLPYLAFWGNIHHFPTDYISTISYTHYLLSVAATRINVISMRTGIILNFVHGYISST